MNPFVVLASPRSGSGWLIDTLNSHPKIVAYTELFHHEARTGPKYGASDVPYYETYVTSVSPWTRRASFCHRAMLLRRVYSGQPEVLAVGLKLMYGQAQAHWGLLPLLSIRRARAVHLIRANLLEALVSWKVAQKTGIYHSRLGDTSSGATVLLDPKRLRMRLEAQELAVSRARALLVRYRFPRLELAYEELVARREETLGRVLSFLGVEPRVDLLDSSLVRTTSGGHLELVENADDVRSALTGTRFEWMLGDQVAARAS